jgi:uncharacterized SAM-binding protein YcdF (DUF218 family)
VLRLALLLAAGALVVTFVVASSVLFVWPSQDSPRHADAVVVLAGSKRRLGEGLKLMRAGVARVLVISDGNAPAWPQANRLCAGHATFRVICFHPSPYSTQGEAEQVARLGRRYRWRSVVVVTSAYHVTRAKLLFERCFAGRVQAVAAPIEWSSLPLAIPSEWSKLLYALTVTREC